MTMPAEPAAQGSNPLTNKIAGMPGFVWLIGAAVLAYFFFSRSGGSSGSGGTSTAGATGSGTTTAQGGETTIDTGAVQISVNANGSGATSTSGGGGGGSNPQPTPGTQPQTKSVSNLQAVKSGTHEVISWRPPQFPSETGVPTTYMFSINPAPTGGSAAAHNIGSRTSYNVGRLKKGTKYTATITPNISGAAPQSTSFTY